MWVSVIQYELQEYEFPQYVLQEKYIDILIESRCGPLQPLKLALPFSRVSADLIAASTLHSRQPTVTFHPISP